MQKKLIVSGLSETIHADLRSLVDDIRACIEPTLHRSIDASVLGRFAVMNLVNAYKGSPDVLARKLGFEVRKHD